MPDDTAHGMKGFSLKHAVILLALAALAVLFIVRFEDVLTALSALWSVIAPLLVGCAIAFLLNLIMARLENIYFPHSDHIVVKKTRRPVCLIVSIALIAAFVALVVHIVSGELSDALPALGDGVLTLLDMLSSLLASSQLVSAQDMAYLSSLLTGDSAAWQTSLASITEYVSDFIEDYGGYSSLASLVFSAGKSAVGLVVDTLVAVVFAIYLLAGRERAIAGFDSFAKWLLSKRMYRRASHAARVANECFSRFIFGQCLEGTILGTLCAIGMTILGMPYAASIGLCVGVTSIVPLVGAWVGGIVGALMILSVHPMQAVWFVVFLVCLQQFEGHVIYPNVVGTSVGVPSIWVLVAVFVGGSLFGILGILLGVPVVATILALVKERGSGYRGAHDAEEEEKAEKQAPPICVQEAVSGQAPQGEAPEHAGEHGNERSADDDASTQTEA